MHQAEDHNQQVSRRALLLPQINAKAWYEVPGFCDLWRKRLRL